MIIIQSVQWIQWKDWFAVLEVKVSHNLGSNFWWFVQISSEPLNLSKTKLGMVMHHHTSECHAKNLESSRSRSQCTMRTRIIKIFIHEMATIILKNTCWLHCYFEGSDTHKMKQSKTGTLLRSAILKSLLVYFQVWQDFPTCMALLRDRLKELLDKLQQLSLTQVHYEDTMLLGIQDVIYYPLGGSWCHWQWCAQEPCRYACHGK